MNLNCFPIYRIKVKNGYTYNDRNTIVYSFQLV